MNPEDEKLMLLRSIDRTLFWMMTLACAVVGHFLFAPLLAHWMRFA